MCPIENSDFCLIHYLSYPEADSIKKIIDSEQISVTYSGNAVAMIAKKGGEGGEVYLAKSDIKSAYRLIPVSTEFAACMPSHYVCRAWGFTALT